MQPLNEITVGSHSSKLHLSEVLFLFISTSQLSEYPLVQIRDFSTMGLIQHYKHSTNSFTEFVALFHACLHVLAGSVWVSVGQIVGEEVVEMMGTGGADELAQLNPSGQV